MKKVASLFFATLMILASFSVSALAADSGFDSIPKLFGTFTPQKGVWAEYEVMEKKTQKKITMKMSVVDVMEKDFWYEVKNVEDSSTNIIKMLVTGDPNDPANIKRLIMKSGDTPAQEMPVDFVKMGRKMAVHMFQTRSGVPEDKTGLTVKELGEKEVTVPAGTFKGAEKQILSAEGKVLASYIFSAEILPFGVIFSDSDDSVMKLLAHGKDAVSAITEEPVMMERPPMMPEMPRGMPMGMGNHKEAK
ncbi:hypothetical protein EPN96_08420 [bacterium]|nr:MAG: hypothetical protein EPN96_08420 [bacterium]